MKKYISILTIMALGLVCFGADAAVNVTFKFNNPAVVTKVSVSAGSVSPATVAEDGVYNVTFNNTYSSNIIFSLAKELTVEDVIITNEATQEQVEQAGDVWKINNGTSLQIYSGATFPEGSTFIINTGSEDNGDDDEDNDQIPESAIILKFTNPDAIEKVENDWSGASKSYTLTDGQLVYDVKDGNVPTVILKSGYAITNVTDETTAKDLAKGDIWVVSGSSVRLYAYYAISTKKVMNYGDEILFTVEQDQTTAIDTITDDADNGVKEVFDMSGRRVKAEALTPGVYIIRQGGVTKKVLVK